MDTITHAVPLDGYRIDIRTSSGISGIFDVSPYLKGSAFKELENTSYFRQVTPAHHGIRWPNEQDFGPLRCSFADYSHFILAHDCNFVGEDGGAPSLIMKQESSSG